MSKKINVNPDHYKVAGRERQGENVVQIIQRQAYAQQQAHAERWQAKQPEGVPAQEEVRRIPVESEPAKKPSRPPASKAKGKPKSKARGKSVRSKVPKRKSARSPKTSAKKRNVPARKTRAKGKRGK
jgi:hypothetical protein